MTGFERPTLAVHWAAACGGCDVALLNLGERILDLAETFEIVYWPCLSDHKREALTTMAEGSIDLCLFNGAIRSTDNLNMARMLRFRARVLVAFGSCAHEGCVPGLANLASLGTLIDTVFEDQSLATRPRASTTVAGGRLTLPAMLDAVSTLEQVVPVDYVVPGCPPEPDTAWNALQILARGLAGDAELPAAGTVLGAADTALCEECPFELGQIRVEGLQRPHEVEPGSGCLFDAGLLCLGPATRGGCGARCPRVGVGCRGCYGPPQGIADIGAAMVDGLAALIDVGASFETRHELEAEVTAGMASLVDPAGTLYRFGLAGSPLRRARSQYAHGAEETE